MSTIKATAFSSRDENRNTWDGRDRRARPARQPSYYLYLIQQGRTTLLRDDTGDILEFSTSHAAEREATRITGRAIGGSVYVARM